MDVDKCLEMSGSFGRYQKIFLTLKIIHGVFTCWQIYSFVFILYEPAHWCRTNDPKHIAIPIEEDETFSKCKMYKIDRNGTDYTNHTIGCANGWDFEDSDKVASLVTELELVCDKAILSPNAVSIYFSGILIGAIITGQLSDMFGRKTTTWFCMLGIVVLNVSITFIHNYIVFVTMWFVLAIAVSGSMTCGYILLSEQFPPKHRSLACCLSSMSWGIGLCVLTPIAYFCQNWRHFQLAISLPVTLLLPAWWFLAESQRWLQTKGRHDDVRTALMKIARFNGVDCSLLDQNITEPQEEGNMIFGNKDKFVIKTYSCFDTVRTPNLRRNTIILCFVWLVNSLVYYGLALNSSTLAGNRFLNFFLLGVAEVPAYLCGIWAVPRYGRRHLLLTFHLIAAVACTMTVVVPTESGNGNNLTPVITIMAFIGKFCITLTFTLVWIYSTEQYPTVIRTIGIGLCSVMARVGGMIAPYIMYSGRFISWIPMVIFAALSAMAGVIVLLLPEMLNKVLPQSIEDGENLKHALSVTAAYSPSPDKNTSKYDNI